jgi:hypothetical protein
MRQAEQTAMTSSLWRDFRGLVFLAVLLVLFVSTTAAGEEKAASAHASEEMLKQFVLETEDAETGAGEKLQPLLFVPERALEFVREAVGEISLSDERNRVLSRVRAAKNTLVLAGEPQATDARKEKPNTGREERRKGTEALRLIRLPSLTAERLVPGAEQLTLRLLLRGADGREVSRTTIIPLRASEFAGDPWLKWMTLLQTTPDLLPADGKNRRAWFRPLTRLGISGGQTYLQTRPRRTEPLLRDAPFYVENIVGDLLAAYHAVPGFWAETVAAYRRDPENLANAVRRPSFASRAFVETYALRLRTETEKYEAARPLFYSLAASPSPTRLGAAFDFDFHPEALASFRLRLERDLYGTLDGLNEVWGVRYKTWAEAVPLRTEAARLRLAAATALGLLYEPGPTQPGQVAPPGRALNLAEWMDFRAFQDQLFAETLAAGRDAIRQVAPEARVGFTGGPGAFAFGWDWSRLADAVDVVETYDAGAARALWRDLAPGKPAWLWLRLSLPDAEMTDAFLARSSRALWAAALESGPRGVLLWDMPVASPEAVKTNEDERKTRKKKPETTGKKTSLFDADGKPARAAEVLAADLRALSGLTGRMLNRARRQRGPVAILYSPASVRLNWLVEADRLHGARWPTAWSEDTGGERRESPQMRLREGVADLCADLGLNATWISSKQLADDILRQETTVAPDGSPVPTFRLLFLPRVLALSEREAAAVQAFVEAGGTVVADACCGRFDEHGRSRFPGALDAVFGVDAHREPLWPEPPRPTERVVLRKPARLPDGLTEEILTHLPPVFSVKTFASRSAVEEAVFECVCAGAPVLSVRNFGRGRAVYLNLDLSRYVLDRARSERPTAQALRSALALTLAGTSVWDETLINRAETKLPPGAEIIRLMLPEDAPAGTPPRPARRLVLGVRCNGPKRTHELGDGVENDHVFAEPEPFLIALLKSAWITTLPVADPPSDEANTDDASALASTLRRANMLDGRLDPNRPSLFLVDFGADEKAPATPTISLSPKAALGDVIEAQVSATGQAEGVWSAWRIEVSEPNGTKRPEYGGKIEGTRAVKHRFPTALNDPPGRWTVKARDVFSGLDTVAEFQLTGLAE